MKRHYIITVLSILSVCGLQAQLYYKSNNCIWVGDSVTNYNFGLNSRDYPGLYWGNNNGAAFLKMDCTPSNPRLAFSGDKVFFTGSILASDFILLSDSIDKTDVNPLEDGASLLTAIKPYALAAKTASAKSLSETGSNVQELSYGIDINTLKNIMPKEVATVGNKDYVNYSALIPVLVSGIKTLQQEVSQRQKEIEALTASSDVSGRSKALHGKSAKILSCECGRFSGKADIVYRLPEHLSQCWMQLCDARGRQTCLIDVSRTNRMTVSSQDIEGTEGYCSLIADGKVLATEKIQLTESAGNGTK